MRIFGTRIGAAPAPGFAKVLPAVTSLRGALAVIAATASLAHLAVIGISIVVIVT
jgi:hypothetical protein